MALSLRYNLFIKFFGHFAKRNDTHKDVNGRGLNERYIEIVGKNIDEEILDPINNLLVNIYDVDTCLDRYVVYLESMMGFDKNNNNLYISHNLPTRRNILRKILRLNQIRGTTKCYELLFSMLGLSVTFTETFNDFGFDSPVLFDDPIRRFDMNCDGCSTYTIALTGTATMTPTLLEAILSIIEYNQPINATLIDLSYNGSNVIVPMISDFDTSFDLSFTS